jgi:phage tail sheath protein FI
MTVWADTHKMTIDNLGSGKMCLSNIGNPGLPYEDIEFQDPITKSVSKY